MIPTSGTRPGIPAGLCLTPKRIAARFFQLYSGHALIAPFLKDRLGWIESDVCWWCGGGRQSREHNICLRNASCGRRRLEPCGGRSGRLVWKAKREDIPGAKFISEEKVSVWALLGEKDQAIRRRGGSCLMAGSRIRCWFFEGNEDRRG